MPADLYVVLSDLYVDLIAFIYLFIRKLILKIVYLPR